MKQHTSCKALCTFLMLVSFVWQPVFAQTDEQVVATIVQKDSLFWKAYNSCDMAAFQSFFTTDVEFYHDKGGPTLGIEGLMASSKKNLCGNSNFRLRREAVAGSIEVFPLHRSNVVYGAIISGSHVFYIKEGAKKEYLDGLAKFTHLWLLEDGAWKMTRILSYDHGPAPQRNDRKAVHLTDAVLSALAGTYKGPQSGTIIIQKEGNALVLINNNRKTMLFPETENRFFVKERDLTFEFVRDEQQAVSKMLVREAGNLVEEVAFISRK